MAADGSDGALQGARCAFLNFNADGGAVEALFEHFLHFGDEVVGTLIVDGDVGVAADAEAGHALDFFAGEKQRQEQRHHVLQVHVGVGACIGLRDGHEPGQVAGHHEKHLPVMVRCGRVGDDMADHGDLQRGHDRRPFRIHGDRGEHRVDVLKEMIV